ncbi:30S ribosomal protein S16 [Melioribacteraceae bacterium 4301-Me]|uniref:30S ribosomal protein S16 n=1 Tax=Pyranulibacter aquaticus TaxID=3163344 RepID=UPI003594A5FB
MAVKLRLRRMGKKKQPIYKVVAADSRSPRDGKFIEAIGLYNPRTNPAFVNIKEERALYWLSVGAQPTQTVKNLLSSEGILLKLDLQKRGLHAEKIEAEIENWKKIREAKMAALSSKKSDKKKAKAVETTELSPKEENVEANTTAQEEN